MGVYTDKQMRNGATGSTAEQTSAMPSVDLTAEISAITPHQVKVEASGRWTAPTLSVQTDAGVVDWTTGVSGGVK